MATARSTAADCWSLILAADQAVQPCGARSNEQRVMADLWAEVLGTSGVGINDHFVFDLSGNSLLALQLIDRVNRRSEYG